MAENVSNSNLVDDLKALLNDSETLKEYSSLNESFNTEPFSNFQTPTDLGIAPAPSTDASFYTQVLTQLENLNSANNEKINESSPFSKIETTLTPQPLQPAIQTTLSEDNITRSVISKLEDSLQKYFNTDSNIKTEETPFSFPKKENNLSIPEFKPLSTQPIPLNLENNLQPQSFNLTEISKEKQNSIPLSTQIISNPQIPNTFNTAQPLNLTPTENTFQQLLPNQYINNITSGSQAIQTPQILQEPSESISLKDLQNFITQKELPQNPLQKETPLTETVSTFPVPIKENTVIEKEKTPTLVTKQEQLQEATPPFQAPETVASSIETVNQPPVFEPISTIPSQETWTNLNVNNETSQEIASNTAITNEILGQLTQAVYALAAATVGKTAATMQQPTQPVASLPASTGSIPSKMNAPRESTPTIPGVRSMFA